MRSPTLLLPWMATGLCSLPTKETKGGRWYWTGGATGLTKKLRNQMSFQRNRNLFQKIDTHLDTVAPTCCSRPCGGGGIVGLGKTAGRRWSGGSRRGTRSLRSGEATFMSVASFTGAAKSTKLNSGGFSQTDEPR